MNPLYVLPFDQASEADDPRLGGKCASLARLIRAEAPVPPGFAVTTDAYCAMLAHHDLRSRVETILTAMPVGDVVAQANAAQSIHAAFASTEIPAAVCEAILGQYRDLCAADGADNDLPVAVRSSATAEDLADASFAGQQDTYLWVVGEDAVIERVRDCWASLFTARAIGYRDDRGMTHMDVLMSVAVQKMVNACVAGVAMTIDPLNGDRSKIVIDASWGLGESVVSGEVTPDHFAVDKVMLGVVKRTISCKTFEVVADPESRCTVHRDVAANKQNTPCLDDEQIGAIAKMAKQLEKRFGAPQDIEWAIEAQADAKPGRLMLLQCRPETVWSQKKSTPTTAKTGMEGLISSLLTPVRLRA